MSAAESDPPAAEIPQPFAYSALTLEIQAALAAMVRQKFDGLHDWARLPPEPLCDDLRPYVQTAGLGMPILRHPLLYAFPYFPHDNRLYNAQLAMKRAVVADLEAAGRHGDALMHVERPYRVGYVCDHRADFPTDAAFWAAFRGAWLDSENLWQQADSFKPVLGGRAGPIREMMTARDLALYAALPARVRVYRGQDPGRPRGWSWTLSVTRAHWFGRRFMDASWCPDRITTALVDRERILAVLTGRDEVEVVLNPRRLTRRDAVRPWAALIYPRRLPNAFKRLAREAARVYPLGAASDHGPAHWFNVLRLGEALCDADPRASWPVVCAFAFLHDHARADERADPEHGERAAAAAPLVLKAAGVALTRGERKLLLAAIADHAHGATSPDPTVAACWDADRLDLIRVGTVPDPKFLSTPTAERRALAI